MSESTESTRDVTDETLMQFFDGELDEERALEVAAWIEHHEDARDKLAGLDIIAEVLREQAAADERGSVIDVVDDVLAAIEEGEGAEVIELPARSGSSPEGSSKFDKVSSTGKPSNDNARNIYALAGIAAAIAAGMFFWGRTAPTSGTLADLAPQATEAPAAMKVHDDAALTERAQPAVTADPADAERDAGVEVASVDWGNQMGQVFEVGESGSVVLWINDTADEEEL